MLQVQAPPVLHYLSKESNSGSNSLCVEVNKTYFLFLLFLSECIIHVYSSNNGSFFICRQGWLNNKGLQRPPSNPKFSFAQKRKRRPMMHRKNLIRGKRSNEEPKAQSRQKMKLMKGDVKYYPKTLV